MSKPLAHLTVKQIAALAKVGELLIEIERLCTEAGLPDLTVQPNDRVRVHYDARGLGDLPGGVKIPPLWDPPAGFPYQQQADPPSGDFAARLRESLFRAFPFATIYAPAPLRFAAGYSPGDAAAGATHPESYGGAFERKAEGWDVYRFETIEALEAYAEARADWMDDHLARIRAGGERIAAAHESVLRGLAESEKKESDGS